MKTYDELKALIDQRGTHEVFGAPGEGFAIEQNAEELAHFLVHLQELGVQSVLEIGTGYRAGLARFLHDDMGWRVTSVDIKNYGHQYGGIQFISDTIAGFEYPVFDEPFDLVLIDGDHTYEAVQFDHDYYAKYASKVIAFHDICGLRDCQGVQRYWWEIAGTGARTMSIPAKPILHTGYYEIAAEGDQRGGIGYIVLAEVSTEPEQLLSPETIAKLKVHPLFADEPPPAKPKPTRKPAAKKPTAKTTTPAKKAPVKK